MPHALQARWAGRQGPAGGRVCEAVVFACNYACARAHARACFLARVLPLVCYQLMSVATPARAASSRGSNVDAGMTQFLCCPRAPEPRRAGNAQLAGRLGGEEGASHRPGL